MLNAAKAAELMETTAVVAMAEIWVVLSDWAWSEERALISDVLSRATCLVVKFAICCVVIDEMMEVMPVYSRADTFAPQV